MTKPATIISRSADRRIERCPLCDSAAPSHTGDCVIVAWPNYLSLSLCAAAEEQCRQGEVIHIDDAGAVVDPGTVGAIAISARPRSRYYPYFHKFEHACCDHAHALRNRDHGYDALRRQHAEHAAVRP